MQEKSRLPFTLVSSSVFLLAFFSISELAGQQISRPLSLQDILDLQKVDAPCATLIKVIQKRGIRFEVTEDVKKKLTSAGVCEEAIVASVEKGRERVRQQKIGEAIQDVCIARRPLPGKVSTSAVTEQVPTIPAAQTSETEASNRKAVDEAMRDGEAAFRKGDFDKAVVAFRRAFSLDAKLYDAALFAGEVYMGKGDLKEAGFWFQQAINIDPDREIAYRYWGNALMAAGKFDEARMRFIDAMIAEPYNWRTSLALAQWAERKQVTLSHPIIDHPIPKWMFITKDRVIVNRDLMLKKDGSQNWVLYGVIRRVWIEERFAKNHPDEKVYRRSLPEEAEALCYVAETVSNDLKEGKIQSLSPALGNLIRLNAAGLLEAYILFAGADEGIRRDYPPYRMANRDKLRRYLAEFYVSGAKGDK